MANHLSPNDIQIICADVEPWREYLYVVTGQKHEGIIWLIERLVEKLCPSIWLERKSADERKSFTKAVLDVARVRKKFLVVCNYMCIKVICQKHKNLIKVGVNVTWMYNTYV